MGSSANGSAAALTKLVEGDLMNDRPFTTRALRALELADATAAQLGTEYVGTEHLLIELLEEKTGPAAQILNHLGVTTERVKTTWQEQTGKPL